MTADEIYRRRLALGLSQAKLAKALGVTVGAVSRWERGSMAPALYLAMAFEALERRQLGANIMQALYGIDAGMQPMTTPTGQQALDPERVARGLMLLKIEEAIADGGPSRGADWLADMRTKMGAASHDELRGMVAGLLKTKGARS